jgi:tRNA-splicing endonuclease subunit Sen2
MTSEQVTAKRRAERQQFKIDRAKAMAAVAAEAEKAFAEGRDYDMEAAKASIPSAATWKPSTSTPSDPITLEENSSAVELEEATAQNTDELIEDMEHLQLTLPEAFFLAWALDCLTILDPSTLQPMSLPEIFASFHSAHMYSAPGLETGYSLRPDNPFLVHYILYHHYRSLGWVVKGGIKFCVDYLLYKRGPVFHHAEYVQPPITPSMVCALTQTKLSDQICFGSMPSLRGPG